MTLSTRKAWFSAPRANFSSSRRRNSGVAPAEMRDVEGKGRKHDPGQQRRVEEHHRQEHEGEEQIDDQGERRAGQKVADVLELAHARDRIADAPCLEIGDRQRQQMAEQPRAQLDVDAVGRVREKIGAQDAEDGLEYPDRDEPDHEHVERAHAAMHEHLVDHHLEEQRRDQREELQEEGGDQHLAEEPTVFVNGTEEPGDIEASREIEQSGSPGHQDQTARPTTASNSARVISAGRGDDGDCTSTLSSPTLPRNKKTAVLERRYRRQRVLARRGHAVLSSRVP